MQIEVNKLYYTKYNNSVIYDEVNGYSFLPKDTYFYVLKKLEKHQNGYLILTSTGKYLTIFPNTKDKYYLVDKQQ